ncbi:MAG: KamA family radical SAM protein, partial [Phycisphaerae bacterium]|nr:KamA family radical SAM protein [Phycisphaerae bacterium]
MTKTKYLNDLKSIKAISESQKADIQKVTDQYRFRSNDYYLSLINWDDPDDPIRRLIVPDLEELEVWGSFDPSQEHFFTIIPGLEHKYKSTALLLVSNVCGGICRYCFRKRVFISKHGDILQDLPSAIEYISQHEEITNVLLTGGDPLTLSTGRLEKIIHALMKIDHVKIIRLGTKMLAFDPNRVLDDPTLCDLIESCVDGGKQIYMMTHFNHIREITDLAIKSVNRLHHVGAVL